MCGGCRITIDKQKFGRNAYNDLYHWTARYSYLEKLIAEGREDLHIVYIDPDVLVRCWTLAGSCGPPCCVHLESPHRVH